MVPPQNEAFTTRGTHLFEVYFGTPRPRFLQYVPCETQYSPRADEDRFRRHFREMSNTTKSKIAVLAYT